MRIGTRSLRVLVVLAVACGNDKKIPSTEGPPPDVNLGAAIAFHGVHSTQLAAGETALTLKVPDGTQANDALIASIAVIPGSVKIGVPDGWALIRRVDDKTTTASALITYQKLAGNAEPAAYTWSLQATSQGAVGAMQAYAGVDTANIIDVQAGKSTPNGLSHAAPSVPATVRGSVLLTFYTFASASKWSPPAEMTEVFDLMSEAAGPSGVSMEGAVVALSGPGSTLEETATADADADAGSTQSIVLSQPHTNAAPTATNLSAPETYTENVWLNLTDIVVRDDDSATVTATLTLSDPAAGRFSIGTVGSTTSTFAAGVWRASGSVSDVNALLASVLFLPTTEYNSAFTIAVLVSDGAADVSGAKAMTGIAVNAPPMAAQIAAPESYTEGAPLNLTDIVVTDADGPAVTVTLTLSNTAAGSLSTATAGAVTSTFVAGVWTASGAPSDVNTLLAALVFTPAVAFNADFAILVSVSDGVAPPVTGIKMVTGSAVNDPPTAMQTSTAEVYTEDTPLNLVDIVVADIDSNLTVTLTLSNIAAGSLSVATAGAVTSTFNSGTGVWRASGPVTDVNTLLAGVVFTPTLNFNAAFTLAVNVSDGIAPALTGTKAFTGIAVNDAPLATNTSAAEAYTEDTALDLVNIVVTDVDSSVTVTLTLTNTSAGTLSTATSGAVTSTFGSGVWSAAGAVADVNTLLAGVTFNPAANFNGSFSIGVSVSDGVAPAVTGTKTVTGTAVNDAPQATNLSAAQGYTEDTALALTTIVVSDVDNANTTVTLTLSNTTAGTLNTATSGSVTSTFAAGVWTASGAIASVNTLLAGLSFTPTLNFNASFTIATNVSDGTAAATGSKAMTGTAVNDAPTATNLSAAETYTEDTVKNLTDIVVSDVDNANTTATLTLSNSAAGSLTTATSGAVTSTYVAGTGTWTASGAIADVNTLLAAVSFTPAANFNGSFTIATSVSDGSLSATGSKAMTGTAVNDAPTATNMSAAETYVHDVTLNLIDIVVSDVDSANVTVTLTLSNATLGSLTTATSGAVTSTYNNGTGVWTASGAIANVNTLLSNLSLVPKPASTANFTIAVSVTDGTAPAITGTKAITGT